MEMRISRDSSKLIQSLDPDTRYIKFFNADSKLYSAVICSQVTDQELSVILTGKAQSWAFDDVEKAIRSIRRLNKDIQIYTGTFDLDFTRS